jgi:hypothetical protein
MARRRLARPLTIRLDSKSPRALNERASCVLGLSERCVGAIETGPVAQGRKARERLRGWGPDRRG